MIESKKIRVLFFGRLKDIVGTNEIVASDIKDIEDLKKYLFDKFPKLKGEIFSVALNYEIIYTSENLKDNDEVALIPPVAGG
ncbi:MAG: MoaD/ThiS family protein [Candidatus Calescibacterium sp.]|jgi:molybdopterin synthase sulfur carrier subunit